LRATRKTIEEIISGHEARDTSLRHVFLEKKVDLTEPRMIECHFWTWSAQDADGLAEALRKRSFKLLALRPAGIAEDPDRWNLEVAIRQSIDLTMRREFIDELVRLADTHGGIYDGWGTRV
jgi:hypothetical protein